MTALRVPCPSAVCARVLAACALVLAGCAAPDLRAIEASTYASAKPCCRALQDLPPALPLQAEQGLALGAGSPHFDFGAGLAPFAVYKLDGSIRFLGLLSKPQGPQPFEFADLRATFLDTQGRPMAPALMTPPIVKTHGALGWYALTRYVAVPDGAASVVIGTGTVQAGRQAVTSGQVPGGGVMLGSIFIPLAGGTLQFPYVHAIYGEGWLQALSTAPR